MCVSMCMYAASESCNSRAAKKEKLHSNDSLGPGETAERNREKKKGGEPVLLCALTNNL